MIPALILGISSLYIFLKIYELIFLQGTEQIVSFIFKKKKQ